MQRLDTEIAWTCAWCADPIRSTPRECPAGCGARVHAACAHEARGCTTPGCDGLPPRPAPGALRLQPRESPDARCAWCHDALGTDARACPDGCGVTTHPGCAEEYGGCPTLGCAPARPGRPRPQVHVRPERAARELLEQRALRRRRDRRRQELGVTAAGFLILALWWCGWDAFAGVVGVVTVVLIALFPRLLRWAEARQEPRTLRPALGIEGWAAGGAIGFAAGIGATLICVAARQAAG
ncbi:MAG: hypothetical protein R3F62_05535 [Planctomycetota bacterium]